MKKIIFGLAAVALLAAGCNGETKTSVNTGADMQDHSAMQQQGMDTQVKADVKVSNVDDAVNTMEKDSTNEQASASNGDDSDLTSSDQSELNSMTEVQNGY